MMDMWLFSESKLRTKFDTIKVWLTKTGRAIVAHNKSNIPVNKLNKLLEIISDNFYLICTKWTEKFGNETLQFYC